jgi:hypothetical protein
MPIASHNLNSASLRLRVRLAVERRQSVIFGRA